MERLEPRLAEYFLAVAEEQHFTRAAARLHIAQPSLSAAIRQLETQLGVTLFERTTRYVSLTAAGEALMPRARDMLASAAEAVTVTRAAADSLPARLTIGVTRSAHAFGLALIRALQKHVPTLQIDVRHDFAAPLEDRLLAGELELALIFCPARHPGLRHQRLADLPAVVSVHPSHRLAQQPALKIEELRHETLSLAPDWIGPGYNKAILGLCLAAGLKPATAVSVGYMPPRGFEAHQTLGITAEAALDGIPLPHEIHCIPLPGHTLPVDLVCRAGQHTTITHTAFEIARELHHNIRDQTPPVAPAPLSPSHRSSKPDRPEAGRGETAAGGR
jgi:DNA-binding transcriptional LysR family regulator